MNRLLTAAICVLVLCAAPAAVGAEQPQAAQSRLSGDWKRIVNGDLIVIGNAPERSLAEVLREVATFRSTLKAFLPNLRVTAPEPTIVVVFRDRRSFEPFQPRDGRGRRQENVAGYFFRLPTANLLVLPLFVRREFTYQVLFHEYTHFLVHRNAVRVPLWFNEGIAEFYSTFETRDDGRRAVIGRAPAERLPALRSRPIPSIARLFDNHYLSRVYESDWETEMFYAHAWAFVHYMTLGNDGRRQGQLRNYLQALQTASSTEAAAESAFGTSIEHLDRELRSYARQLKLPAVILTDETFQRVQVPSAERMTEADAAHLRGVLLNAVGAKKDADEQLTTALSLDPQHLGSRVEMGKLRISQDRADEGLALLVSAAQEAPQDFGAQYHLASALGEAARYEESLRAFDSALKLNQLSVDAWMGLSTAALRLGRTAQSDAAFMQVRRLDSDAAWHERRARLAFGEGRHELAAREARTFIEAAGWADGSSSYAAFVAALAYRRLGQKSEADDLLQKVATVVRPGSWPHAVVEYLQERLADEAFLRRAQDNGERTEAHAYVGLRMVEAGNRQAAREHLTWVKERGERNYTEYDLAIAELKRLPPE